MKTDGFGQKQPFSHAILPIVSVLADRFHFSEAEKSGEIEEGTPRVACAHHVLRREGRFRLHLSQDLGESPEERILIENMGPPIIAVLGEKVERKKE